jgi:hypothetical protein
MVRQRKIAILLTLAGWFVIGGGPSVRPAAAADPQEQGKAIKEDFEKAS